MKLYSAAADVHHNFSEKAKKWYYETDVLIQKNLYGMYFIRLAGDRVEGPYTIQQLNDICEKFQDQLDDLHHMFNDLRDQYHEMVDDWFNEDDEDLEDLMDGDLEDIFEAFYVDDNLTNDIDRRVHE